MEEAGAILRVWMRSFVALRAHWPPGLMQGSPTANPQHETTIPPSNRHGVCSVVEPHAASDVADHGLDWHRTFLEASGVDLEGSFRKCAILAIRSLVASRIVGYAPSLDRQEWHPHNARDVRDFVFIDVGARFRGLAHGSMSLQLLELNDGRHQIQVIGVGSPHGEWHFDDDSLIIRFHCKGEETRAKRTVLQRIARTSVWIYEGVGADAPWSCQMIERNVPQCRICMKWTEECTC